MKSLSIKALERPDNFLLGKSTMPDLFRSPQKLSQPLKVSNVFAVNLVCEAMGDTKMIIRQSGGQISDIAGDTCVESSSPNKLYNRLYNKRITPKRSEWIKS
jgi:hypothetical protein